MKARELAQGKWRGVLPLLGIPKTVLDGKHHPCPSTGQGEDRFRFADRNGSGNYFCDCSDGTKGGIGLVMCCKGIGYAEAAKEVEAIVGRAETDPPREKRDPRPALKRVQERLKPVGFTVRRYLQDRGLQPPPGVRQARLRYWDGRQSLGDFDCMVGKIVDAKGQPQSFHVTYLDGAGKAAVPSPRKVMTPVDTVTGCAIRLYPAAGHVGIAEGIETAIAAHLLSGLPVWSVITAHGIETFDPPAGTDRVTVFADHDDSYTGQAAAFACAKRLAKRGIAVDVRMPEQGDWNDELRRGAA